MVIDCKSMANTVIEEAKQALNGQLATLAVISCNNDAASAVYVNNKRKACKRAGINFLHYDLDPNSTSELYIQSLLDKLSKDDNVHGIILQEPVFIKENRIDTHELVQHIAPVKDVDGFTDFSRVRLINESKEHYHIPCTVKGILDIIDEWMTDCVLDEESPNPVVLIAGRSSIVGAPLYDALRARKMTIVCVNSSTSRKQLELLSEAATIIVSAVGNPKMFDYDMLWHKDCKLFIDVGINSVVEEYSKKTVLVGDCSEYLKERYCESYTTVPGGVGPLTVANLVRNVVNAKLWMDEIDEWSHSSADAMP